ncbi:hypothetical protein [Subtercola sp. RTI3]|uniref:hypothetical protein n=1 Tax=Subtercola sp. RTI3 TaxID=3048639 RepID=UPI002B22D427|nr:hypothetical protein [Subtercola sp. RTI3]MEA9986323.1 hypothetical protein [Subtercola sp. RTI3]
MSDLLGVFTSIISAGALAAAVAAGIAAWRVVEIERRRDARSQALHISSWVSERPTATGQTRAKQYGVEILNVSTSPVTDVTIYVRMLDGTAYAPLALRVLPPGHYFAAQGARRNRRATDGEASLQSEKKSDATYEAKYKWAFPESVESECRPIWMSETWRVQSMTFTDRANITWERTADGVLSELPAPHQQHQGRYSPGPEQTGPSAGLV